MRAAAGRPTLIVQLGRELLGACRLARRRRIGRRAPPPPPPPKHRSGRTSPPPSRGASSRIGGAAASRSASACSAARLPKRQRRRAQRGAPQPPRGLAGASPRGGPRRARSSSVRCRLGARARRRPLRAAPPPAHAAASATSASAASAVAPRSASARLGRHQRRHRRAASAPAAAVAEAGGMRRPHRGGVAPWRVGPERRSRLDDGEQHAPAGLARCARSWPTGSAAARRGRRGELRESDGARSGVRRHPPATEVDALLPPCGSKVVWSTPRSSCISLSRGARGATRRPGAAPPRLDAQRAEVALGVAHARRLMSRLPARSGACASDAASSNARRMSDARTSWYVSSSTPERAGTSWAARAPRRLSKARNCARAQVAGGAPRGEQRTSRPAPGGLPRGLAKRAAWAILPCKSCPRTNFSMVRAV